ncbi:MAG TPA: hypothetical protein VK609_21645 [Mucilaginibacter sp.]|nr:hypothetical protein [Mucilaginibacter sp.]
MKTILNRIFTFMVICLVTCSLPGCKKDRVSPETVTTIDAIQTPNARALSGSYIVSSLVSGRTQQGSPPVSTPNVAAPFRICSAADGTMYVTAPNAGGLLYKINPAGKVTRLPDLDSPIGIKAGANGSVYLTRMPFASHTSTIVKIDKNQVMTTLPVSVGLSNALDLAITPDSTLYIADEFNRRIVKLTKQGIASVFAGKTGQLGLVDGQGENARFSYPIAIRYANDGTLWVIDGDGGPIGSQTIRKITLDGKVTTFFKLSASQHSYIQCLAVTNRDKDFQISPYENAFMFITDFTSTQKNQLFHLSYKKVLTPITDLLPDGFRNGDAAQATFFSPSGITVNPRGIFVADQGNNAIRKITKK